MKLKSILILLFVVTFALPVVAKGRHGGYGGSGRPQQKTTYTVYNNNNQYNISMVYGIAAGLTCPILRFDGNSADVSSNPGFKIGMMWGVDFGVVEIVPELWYSTFKMNFNEDIAGLKGAKLTNNSLDFPILVGFKLGGPFRLNLGPTFSLLCNNTINDNGKESEYGRIKSNVGYVAGLGWDVVQNLFLDVRYTGRFNSSCNEWNSKGDPYNISMYTIDITAGFRF